jgi:hypothetical protein
VESLGFAGLEIGPSSFNASLEEDAEQTLGIMNAMANICTYRSKKKNNDFKVELYIAPNF